MTSIAFPRFRDATVVETESQEERNKERKEKSSTGDLVVVNYFDVARMSKERIKRIKYKVLDKSACVVRMCVFKEERKGV